jgi:ubiquinone/menaquinone biosynthesis C-methylase UbiE
MNEWTFNEFKHCGVDYSDTTQAAHYEEEHQKFRNFEQEIIDLLNNLSLDNPQKMTLIDLGCGTGATSIAASRYFKKIYAVDVSEAMINCARKKTKEQGIKNIEFINSGFLSYEHKFESADIVLSKAALHHLPDFWKQIAFLKINKMLKMNGILYLFDIVFNFPPLEYEEKINNWISHFEQIAGRKVKKEIEIHIKEEFSTFNWIMEGMLSKAGFNIEKINTPDGMQTEYFCRKSEEKNI